MNGSLYALLLYLVIYLQDVLGYSALGAGLRLAIISGAQFVTATLAGRVSHRVPARWLIGPGLLLVGVGLIIMAGQNGMSSWTQLIPGFVVAGLGAGLVNPPLASAAISVVPPQRAGMASGVNTTFRQVGIATGIAALGSVFTTAMERNLNASLAHVPSLAGSTSRVLTLVRQGEVGTLLAHLPPAVRGQAATAVRSGFVAGLNDLMLITGTVAIVGAMFSVMLIRPSSPTQARLRTRRHGWRGSARTPRSQPPARSMAARDPL